MKYHIYLIRHRGCYLFNPLICVALFESGVWMITRQTRKLTGCCWLVFWVYTCYSNIRHAHCGYNSRVAFLSFSMRGGAATVQEWLLIKSGIWSNRCDIYLVKHKMIPHEKIHLHFQLWINNSERLMFFFFDNSFCKIHVNSKHWLFQNRMHAWVPEQFPLSMRLLVMMLRTKNHCQV